MAEPSLKLFTQDGKLHLSDSRRVPAHACATLTFDVEGSTGEVLFQSGTRPPSATLKLASLSTVARPPAIQIVALQPYNRHTLQEYTFTPSSTETTHAFEKLRHDHETIVSATLSFPMLSTELEGQSLKNSATPDTVLVFPPRYPASAQRTQYLYAFADKITAASPIFEAMLSSGFAESAWRDHEPAVGYAQDLDPDDSDAESDSVTSSTSPASPHKQRKGGKPTASQATASAVVQPSVRYVVIRGHAFKTYRATMHWLATGKIKFASIKSAGSPSQAHELAASPRSIFCLASYLELNALKLAATNYLGQLTAHNVVKETFSRMSVYDDLRPRLVKKMLELQPDSIRDVKLAGQYSQHSHFLEIISAILAGVKVDPDRLKE